MLSETASEKAASKLPFNLAYLVHVGNLVALAGMSQTDMLNLRCLLVISTTLGISYNLLQPTPLVPPAAWGGAFLLMHMYIIVTLLRERQPLVLNQEEEALYEKAFHPAGFTPRQFLDLLSVARPRWCSWGKDHDVVKRGSDMDEIHTIIEGEAVVMSSTDDALHKILPGKGSWLGEVYDPSRSADYWNPEKPHIWPVSFRCASERCVTVAFPRRQVDEAFKANPRMEQAATKAVVSDLWGKYYALISDMRPSTYRSMMEIALTDGVLDPSEREALLFFKQHHRISDEVHLGCLQELGWSAEEFETGRRKGWGNWLHGHAARK